MNAWDLPDDVRIPAAMAASGFGRDFLDAADSPTRAVDFALIATKIAAKAILSERERIARLVAA